MAHILYMNYLHVPSIDKCSCLRSTRRTSCGTDLGQGLMVDQRHRPPGWGTLHMRTPFLPPRSGCPGSLQGKETIRKARRGIVTIHHATLGLYSLLHAQQTFGIARLTLWGILWYTGAAHPRIYSLSHTHTHTAIEEKARELYTQNQQ